MVAQLAQLYDRVHQRLSASLAVLALLGTIGEQDTLALHVLVENALERGHVALDDVLDLVGQLVLYLLFEATQQEGTKNLVQATNDKDGLLLV